MDKNSFLKLHIIKQRIYIDDLCLIKNIMSNL